MKKELLSHDQPRWNMDMEAKLRRFPIVLHSDEWRRGTDFHYHPGIEIHVTLDGNGTMVVGNRIFMQSPRSVLMFRGMVPHQMISTSSYKRTVVSVSFTEEESRLIADLYGLIDFSWIPKDSCLSFCLEPKEFLQLLDMCKAIKAELDDKKVGWERMALAHMLQLTVFLQRCSANQAQLSTLTNPTNGRKNDLVQLCSDYVCNNLGDDLSLKSMARKFTVSEEHLTRSFTREMNTSFYQYVLLQRMAKAKRLLREEPNLSISDIAYILGFTSPSHFSRHFKLLTEETPSVYRLRMIDTSKWPPLKANLPQFPTD
jgi:AraC-like DNA-binding protein/mannose-6-phosphate isomerase-like protein (cupin superfamily)